MSEKKEHDSVLMGWADEPVFYEDQLSRWTVRLHASNIKEVLEKYCNEKGYARLELFMSKAGKPFLRVSDPNSAKAKEYKAKKEAEVAQQGGDDLPF